MAKNKLQVVDKSLIKRSRPGHPALYESNIELEKAIDEYFVYIQGKGEYRLFKTPHGTQYDRWVWEREPTPPTITGLAHFLGFESRQSFYDYEKNGQFSYTIRSAKLFIESKYEAQLWTQNSNGAIFALKNLGWRDQPEPVDPTKLNIIIE